VHYAIEDFNTTDFVIGKLVECRGVRKEEIERIVSAFS
jgi:hypothetical protein